MTAILEALSGSMKLSDLPSKSALSQFRKRIHWSYFKDRVFEMLENTNWKRKKWKGLYVYAIDGIQLTLPRSQDIVEADYSGRKVSKYRESYMPKMFLVAAVDVFNGIVRDLREHPTLNEIGDAKDMVPDLEEKSLCLYDRLYLCRDLMRVHQNAGNHFLGRLKKNVCKELRAIFKGRRKHREVVFEGRKIQLFKIKNPKTKKYDCFATSLPLKLVDERVIRGLYNLRWEVENTFRDFTKTIKLEQWHSKFINGIRQELWAAVWLYNFVKMKICEHHNPIESGLAEVYYKPNFKLIFGWITSRIESVVRGLRGFKKMIVELIDRSMEKRERHSRSYKREIKSPRSPFPYNNTRWYGLN